jgi:hypothetical protein
VPTFYVTVHIRGGHIALLEESAREYGVELLAVNGLSVAEMLPQEKGVLEGDGTYLFLRRAMTLQGALVRVKHYAILAAKERFWSQEFLASPGIVHESEPVTFRWDYLTGL